MGQGGVPASLLVCQRTSCVERAVLGAGGTAGGEGMSEGHMAKEREKETRVGGGRKVGWRQHGAPASRWSGGGCE